MNTISDLDAAKTERDQHLQWLQEFERRKAEAPGRRERLAWLNGFIECAEAKHDPSEGYPTDGWIA